MLDWINGPADVEMSSVGIYASVCHGADMLSTEQAQQLGYRTIPDDEQEITIFSPMQRFDKVASGDGATHDRIGIWPRVSTMS